MNLPIFLSTQTVVKKTLVFEVGQENHGLLFNMIMEKACFALTREFISISISNNFNNRKTKHNN